MSKRTATMVMMKMKTLVIDRNAFFVYLLNETHTENLLVGMFHNITVNYERF